MTLSRLDHVLEALVEQAAVHYAVVTSSNGTTVGEAGNLPQRPRREHSTTPGPEAPGTGPFHIRMMVEVGGDHILHMGTTRRFPRPEVRALRSVVASVV